LTRRVDPVYPAAARREGQEGTVHLRLEIKPDGRVGKVDVVTSSGFQLLDDAAVAAARKWRYEPAREDGRPVAEWRRVAVVFRLEGDAPLRVFPRPHS
jgi:protein TonB